jgi:hypothetical protein
MHKLHIFPLFPLTRFQQFFSASVVLCLEHFCRTFLQNISGVCVCVCVAIIVAVTEGLVREEQLLHDMCLLGAVTVEITQILTRAS